MFHDFLVFPEESSAHQDYRTISSCRYGEKVSMVIKEAQERQRRWYMSCILIAPWKKCDEFMAFVGVRGINAWCPKGFRGMRASEIQRGNGAIPQCRASS